MVKLKLLSSAICLLLSFGGIAQAQKSPYLKANGGVQGQFIRISLPGDKRILTLAEVEVYSSGKNIAPKGNATQSSTVADGGPKRAMDGNKSSDYRDDGQTHTDETSDPWWELDLGENKQVSGVGIWNRASKFDKRLDKFTLTILDDKRAKVFELKGIAAPASSIHLVPSGDGKPKYINATGPKSPKPAKAKPTDWKGDGSDAVYWRRRDPVDVPNDYREDKPFAFQKGDTIALIGNGLGERFQHAGDIEAQVQSTLPEMAISFRNMCVSGDTVDKFPRSKGFTPMDAYLQLVKADAIFCFFGYNESFENKPEEYTKRLVNFVKKLRSFQPNGKSFPRIVLFSPIAHENLKDANLPNGRANNKRLAKYTDATRNAAELSGVTFVDLFSATKTLYKEKDEPLTMNGIHLNKLGASLVGSHIATQLAGEVGDSATSEKTGEIIADKNWHWFNRYRATDGNDIWGGRSKLKFVDGQTNAEVLQHELIMIDKMVKARDRGIWAAAQGETITISDDKVPPPVKVISNVGGGSRSSSAAKEGTLEYLSGKDGIAKMTVPKGYKVNVFADESMFPEMVNPVQMQVDTKGRVWAAVWPTYPKWEPLKEMKDALVYFEDTDNDGVADKCVEFARVHNPLGFEFWNGGVLVTSQPDLLFLKDTNGDGKADFRQVILHGFGSSDTHHTANNLVYGPDGHIYWQSGVFLQHNHEHPWGASLQTGSSAMFRFDPRRFTIAHHANNSPNPHGIAFDGWGYHYANDGTGGRPYQVRPDGKGFKMHPLLKKEVRPVAANAIVSSANFPDEIQGNYLLANTIGFLGLKNYKLHRDGFSHEIVEQVRDKETKKKIEVKKTVEKKVGEIWGTPEEDLLVSSYGNFRPTDAVFGEDGALYVSDWCNIIIGHMQHNIRDPNRDKLHGRIYRVVYEDKPLQKPVAIDGQSLEQLMVNLEHPINGVRHRTRVEISERKTSEVIAAAEKWIAKWDATNPDHARHLLEGLWVHQQHNVRNRELLDTVLKSPVEHARIAAATVKHHWDVADPALGAQEIEEEEEMELLPGGVESDTADLTTVRINTVVEQLRYDVKEFEVKAGKAIKLIFVNPDALPHNLVIVKPGTADKVANAAIAMGADGFAKKFIPESSDVLHYTDLIDGGVIDELNFTAPTEPGDYQFVCTFPGHALIMRGVMKVK